MGTGADFCPWGSIVVLLASGALAFGLAIYLFSWHRQNAKRRGHPLLTLLSWVPYVMGIILL
jgi:hypothetical protein